MGWLSSLRCCVARAKPTFGQPAVEDKVISAENVSGAVADLPEDLPDLELAPECGICLDSSSSCQLLFLGCGHSFCEACIQGQLTARWPGSQMNFSYLNCALCRQPMVHEEVKSQLSVHRELQSRAARVAVQKFSADGNISDLQQELGRPVTDSDVSNRALAEMTVFQCCTCQEPYCAGRMDCAAAAQYDMAEAKPTRCPSCEWETLACANDHRCMLHGHRFAMFKCDSCCEVATWNCYSNHYCERCHNQAGEKKHYPCPGPEKCALGMLHPPNQEAVHCSGDFASFCIGCTACLGCTEAQDEDFNAKVVFGFEERWLTFTCGKEVLEALGEQEVRSLLKKMQPELADMQDESGLLSAEICADQLLPLAVESFKKSSAEAEIRAEKASLEQERHHEMWEKERIMEAQEQVAEQLFQAGQDKEFLCSSSALDWRALREKRRSDNALRSAARSSKLNLKKNRLVKGRVHSRGGQHKIHDEHSEAIADYQMDTWVNERDDYNNASSFVR